MKYRIVITALEENPEYKEQLKAWNARNRYNTVNYDDMPHSELIVKKLETTISEQDFKAVRRALVAEFAANP